METRYIYGKVTAVAKFQYYTAEVEINGAVFTLADVWVRNSADCGDGSRDRAVEALVKAMRNLMPVGTPVVGLLATTDEVYLQVAPGSGPTINELLLRAGYGETNEFAAEDYDDAPEIAPFHQAALDAEHRSEKARDGFRKVCAKAEKVYQRQLKADQRATEELMRQAERAAEKAAKGGADVDVDVDWGDGYCDTCHISWRVFRFLF